MTTREAEKELEDYAANKQYCNELLDEFIDTLAKIKKIEMVLSENVFKDYNKKIEELTEKARDKLHKYIEKTNMLYDENEKVLNKIENVRSQKSLYGLILVKRFVSNKKMTKVADEILYDYKYSCKLQNKAVKLYSNIN